MAIATGVTGLVRATPERRRAILRCRFTIGKAPCHTTWFPPYCQHMEQAMYEAGNRFVADLAKHGWEWQGKLALTGDPSGDPYPVTQVATSVPKAPAPKVARLGPRSTAPDSYPEGIVFDVPTLGESDAVDYELAGAFVRLLLPTEVLETDLPTIEAAAAKRKRTHGRR